MKASKLIADLQLLDPQEELIVAYWIKDEMSDMNEPEITPEAWSKTVHSYENGEFGWQSDAYECIFDLIEEASA